MISPQDSANALLIAWDCPRSDSLRQRTELPAARRMSMLPSVEPPSITMCSMSGYVWQATERRLSASHAAWLYDGVSTETSCEFCGPKLESTPKFEKAGAERLVQYVIRRQSGGCRRGSP